ncbi:hypothetical protein M413DRAFT_444000 [Hebeloma cylindrosporum]|uniref:Uncharacterized protein n=1 Tax=Hebeloma cylindrosporum TaxID=76867 RepID=A0A0C3CGA6_HEBCY|nr:hypothetical protein M413DRAFT_444000 [Hebeloma cylindrosporum h7]
MNSPPWLSPDGWVIQQQPTISQNPSFSQKTFTTRGGEGTGNEYCDPRGWTDFALR